jgi:hypothetical protein
MSSFPSLGQFKLARPGLAIGASWLFSAAQPGDMAQRSFPTYLRDLFTSLACRVDDGTAFAL